MIEFPGGAFSCMDRNLFEQGAALDIASSIRIPPYFTLVIPAEGSRFYCHSVWRSDRRHSHSLQCGIIAYSLERNARGDYRRRPSLSLFFGARQCRLWIRNGSRALSSPTP
jgi:hypothetical protein